jgi:hypothetical protein
MQWLLLFPGDWHIHQKVLHGEAACCSWKTMAGHRAETLTSLALASHFKRTHHFILRSFEAMYRFFILWNLHYEMQKTSWLQQAAWPLH